MPMASDLSGAGKGRNFVDSTRKNYDSQLFTTISGFLQYNDHRRNFRETTGSGLPRLEWKYIFKATKCKILPLQLCKFSGALPWLQYRPNTMNLFKLKFSATSSGFPNADVLRGESFEFFRQGVTQNGYASAVVIWSRFRFDRIGKLN